MFLSLTRSDGTPITVNMNKVDCYLPVEEDGRKLTSLDIGDNAIHVTQQHWEINDAFKNEDHPLRLTG